MKNTISILSIFFFISSCSKENTASQDEYKEDSNNYFTATFSGKTIKTSGFVTYSGVFGDANIIKATLSTTNNSGTVISNLNITVSGSNANSNLVSAFKFPVQNLDAILYLTKTGDAVGTYKILSKTKIIDLSVGNKSYDLNPVSTVLTVTKADALVIEGNYTGYMLNGLTEVQVSGNFKLKK